MSNNGSGYQLSASALSGLGIHGGGSGGTAQSNSHSGGVGLSAAMNQALCGVASPSQSAAIQSARPDSEIEACMGRAHAALERLHGRISSVEDRLRPVLRSVGQSGGTGSSKPQASVSPLGDALNTLEDSMSRAGDRLEALLLGLAL